MKVCTFPTQILRLFLICSCALALVGCDNSDAGQGGATINGTPVDADIALLEANTTLSSNFATPNADGSFSTTIYTIFKGSYKDENSNGYALELNRNDTAFNAQIGLLSGTTGGDLPTSGGATMSGTYQVVEAGISDGDVRDYGEIDVTSGRISLRADFEFGTLTGSDDTLVIDGTFSGKALSGSAYFRQNKAALGGQIGEDRAVGIFHGTNGATAFAGGFLVEP